MILSICHRFIKPICLAIPLLAVAWVIFLSVQHYLSDKPHVSESIAPERNPALKQRITGFRFQGFHDGKKVITIKADKFTIEKKKLGFFRLALMNEARLANAFIRIFCEEAPTTPGDSKASSNSRPGQSMSFGHVFSKDSLPPMAVKRVFSVMMAPVRIEVYEGKSLVTAISARTGTIRLRRREILFKGSVKVVSGARVLKTDQLRVIPDRGVLRTDYPFVLKDHENRINGKHLLANLFLNPLVEQ
ncbi:MAG TPA: hypothetical protein ENF70_07240 [Deltaproteobacteria bacterium]|nr:LPS export ABC transporter periplasmic protein LptC [Deltaproteobacteria bacterium]HDH98908.1 hypothetical protein [Deltaproteobacteria bacterium]